MVLGNETLLLPAETILKSLRDLAHSLGDRIERSALYHGACAAYLNRALRQSRIIHFVQYYVSSRG